MIDIDDDVEVARVVRPSSPMSLPVTKKRRLG